MTKRWKCTVCGYIHIGEEPPEHCPICGADRAKFIPLDTEAPGLLRAMLDTFTLHPMAAHFPNGLMPTAGLFLLLYFTFGNPCFESATFWLVMVATAVVPVSLGSGLHDWQKHFGGHRAPIFLKKIGLAVTLLTLGLVSISLRYGAPDLLLSADWKRWLFLFCLAGMLICVVLLGHYGGILVSRRLVADRPANEILSKIASDDWPRNIVAQAADAILAADTTGTIRLWNSGAERIFGVPTSRAIGQSLDLIIPETLRQRHWEGWARVMQSGASRYGEELLRVPALRGDGSRFSAEFTVVMLKNETGAVIGVAAILRDVSEQWEREKRLKSQLATCQEETLR